jgi:hypothetical protein
MNPSQKKIIDIWGKVHNTIFKSLSESMAEDELRSMLYQPLKQLGKESGREINGDASAIGKSIMEIESCWEIQGKVLENSSSKFVRQVNYCPWSYFKPIGCKVLGWYMEGFCEAVNSNCRYELEKLIPAGDDVCVWSITYSDI